MHDIAICITLTLEIFISMGQQINFVQQYVVVGAKGKLNLKAFDW